MPTEKIIRNTFMNDAVFAVGLALEQHELYKCKLTLSDLIIMVAFWKIYEFLIEI